MSDKIIIPCDFRHPHGTYCSDEDLCEKGQVLIYGEMGGRPPETITCPKCNGLGKIEVARSEIESQISDLIDERDVINSEIKRFRRHLKE